MTETIGVNTTVNWHGTFRGNVLRDLQNDLRWRYFEDETVDSVTNVIRQVFNLRPDDVNYPLVFSVNELEDEIGYYQKFRLSPWRPEGYFINPISQVVVNIYFNDKWDIVNVIRKEPT